MATRQPRGTRLGAQRLRASAASREAPILRDAALVDDRGNLQGHGSDVTRALDRDVSGFSGERESHAVAIMRRAEEIVAARRAATQGPSRTTEALVGETGETIQADASQMLAARGAAILERIRQRRAEARRLLEEHQRRLREAGSKTTAASAAPKSLTTQVTGRFDGSEPSKLPQSLEARFDDAQQTRNLQSQEAEGEHGGDHTILSTLRCDEQGRVLTKMVSNDGETDWTDQRQTAATAHHRKNTYSISSQQGPAPVVNAEAERGAIEHRSLKNATAFQGHLPDGRRVVADPAFDATADYMSSERKMRSPKEQRSSAVVQDRVPIQNESRTPRLSPSTTSPERVRFPSSPPPSRVENQLYIDKAGVHISPQKHTDWKYPGQVPGESSMDECVQQGVASNMNASWSPVKDELARQYTVHDPARSLTRTTERAFSVATEHERQFVEAPKALGTEMLPNKSTAKATEIRSAALNADATASPHPSSTSDIRGQFDHGVLAEDSLTVHEAAQLKKQTPGEWEALEVAMRSGDADDSWLSPAPNGPSSSVPPTESGMKLDSRYEGEPRLFTVDREDSTGIVDRQRETRASVCPGTSEMTASEQSARAAKEYPRGPAVMDSSWNQLAANDGARPESTALDLSMEAHGTSMPPASSRDVCVRKDDRHLNDRRFETTSTGGHSLSSEEANVHAAQGATRTTDGDESNRLYETALDWSGVFIEESTLVVPSQVLAGRPQTNATAQVSRNQLDGGFSETIFTETLLADRYVANENSWNDPSNRTQVTESATHRTEKSQAADHEPRSVPSSTRSFTEDVNAMVSRAERERLDGNFPSPVGGHSRDTPSSVSVPSPSVASSSASRYICIDEMTGINPAIEVPRADRETSHVRPAATPGHARVSSPTTNMSNEIGMHSGSDRVPGESDGWQALKLWPQSGPTQGDDADRGSHQPKPIVTSTHSVHEDEEDVHASTPRRDIAWSPEASQIPESMPRVRLADSVSRQIWQPAQSEEASNSQSLESGTLESEREHTGWCSPASHEGLERSTSLRHDQSDCESRGTPNTGASIALNAVDDRPLLPVPFPSADERTDQASSTLIEAHITADVDRGQYPDTASSSATHSASSQCSFANRNASPMHAPGMEPIKLPVRWSPPAPHDETSMRNDWESMSAAALKSKSALWGTIAGGAAFFSSTETTTVSAFAADGRTTSAYNQQEQHAAADAHASSDHWETSAAETRAEAASGGQAPTLLGEECLEPSAVAGQNLEHAPIAGPYHPPVDEQTTPMAIERSFAAPDEQLIFDAVDANGTPLGSTRPCAHAPGPTLDTLQTRDTGSAPQDLNSPALQRRDDDDDKSVAGRFESLHFDAVSDERWTRDGKPLCPTAAFGALGQLAISAPRILQDLPELDDGISSSGETHQDEHLINADWSDQQLNTDVHVYLTWSLLSAQDGIDIDLTALAHWPGPVSALSDPVSSVQQFGNDMETAWQSIAPEDSAARMLCRLLCEALVSTAITPGLSRAASVTSLGSSPASLSQSHGRVNRRMSARRALPLSSTLRIQLQQKRGALAQTAACNSTLASVETALVEGRFKAAVEAAQRAGDWTLALLLSEAQAGLWPLEETMTPVVAESTESMASLADDADEDRADEADTDAQQSRLQIIRQLLDSGYARNSPVALLLAVMIVDEQRIQAQVRHLQSPAGGSWPWQALLASLWILCPWQMPQSSTRDTRNASLLSKAFMMVAEAFTSVDNTLDLDRIMLCRMAAAESPWTPSFTHFMEIASGLSFGCISRAEEANLGTSPLVSSLDKRILLTGADAIGSSSRVIYRLLFWELYQTLWWGSFQTSGSASNDAQPAEAMKRSAWSLYTNLADILADIGRISLAEQYRAVIADQVRLHNESLTRKQTACIDNDPGLASAAIATSSSSLPETNREHAWPRAAPSLQSASETESPADMLSSVRMWNIAVEASNALLPTSAPSNRSEDVSVSVSERLSGTGTTANRCVDATPGTAAVDSRFTGAEHVPNPTHPDEEQNTSLACAREYAHATHEATRQQQQQQRQNHDRVAGHSAPTEPTAWPFGSAQAVSESAGTQQVVDRLDDATAELGSYLPPRPPEDPWSASTRSSSKVERDDLHHKESEQPAPVQAMDLTNTAMAQARTALEQQEPNATQSTETIASTSPESQTTEHKPVSRLRQLRQRLFGGWRQRKQANLGLENKFYYDERLGRWICADDDPDATNAAAGLTLPPSDDELAKKHPGTEATTNACSSGAESTQTGAAVPTPAGCRDVPPPPATLGPSTHFKPQNVRQRYVDVLGGAQGANASSAVSMTAQGRMTPLALVRPPRASLSALPGQSSSPTSVSIRPIPATNSSWPDEGQPTTNELQ